MLTLKKHTALGETVWAFQGLAFVCFLFFLIVLLFNMFFLRIEILNFFVYFQQNQRRLDMILGKSISFCYLLISLPTSNMRHLFVVEEFVVVSHLKIFPLQLLGPAEKPMAGPSSSEGKILR